MMTMRHICLLILTGLFAVNMGGGSFAASFSGVYGSGLIKHMAAAMLFAVCVVAGALAGGDRVAVTLGHHLLAQDALPMNDLLIFLVAATLSLWVSNWMQIPQSTSLVTVAALAGIGAAQHTVRWKVVAAMVPFWVGLPVVAFGLTYALGAFVYPPRRINFWLYENVVHHENRLKRLLLISTCYNAFAIGTNNVPNAAGPLHAAGIMGLTTSLIFCGVVFGAGAFVFKKPLETVGEKLVPLGLLTSSLMGLVAGTLIIFASLNGVPQSFVMIQMGALFAVAALKRGVIPVWGDIITAKTLITWTVNPALTFAAAYAVENLILTRP